MSGIKRASYTLEPRIVERAKELRRSGLSGRAIVKQLANEGMKAARSTLNEYFAEDPTCQSDAVKGRVAAAEAAEEDSLTLELEDTIRDSLKVYRGLLHDVAARLKGSSKAKKVFPTHLGQIARGLERLTKLVALRNGQPTARIANVREPAAPEPTEEERRIMDIAMRHGAMQ